LGIGPEDRVLEVGGAGNPFPRANVVCDLTFGACAQRNGAPGVLRADVRYVEAPAENLPFADGEFDFVYCTQVLEHVLDPAAAARELSRVAKRGFVEVPSRAGEMINGNPTHRWVVDRDGDTLVFTPRTYAEHPFRNFFYGLLFHDRELRERAEHTFRNVLNHQVLFNGGLCVRVLPAPAECFNYSNPDEAAWAHLSFAAHTLRGGADPSYGFPDALEAVRLMPEAPDAKHLLAIYYLRLLRPEDALRSLGDLQGAAADALRGAAHALRAGSAFDPQALPIPEVSSSAAAPQMRPKVSLLVMGEDAGALRSSIETALTQDYPDTEIVVASSLARESVLDGLDMASRLKWVPLAAGTTPGAALNRAAQQASGEMVGFVCAPDLLMAHHVDRLVAALSLSSAQLAVSDALLANADVVRVQWRAGNPALSALSLSAVLVRAAAALNCGAFDEVQPDALTLWLHRLAVQAEGVAVHEVTLKRMSVQHSSCSPLAMAETALALKPQELLRDLMAAHVREEGLRAEIRRLKGGQG
jgi:SAM-dependent methyltransferase